MPASRTVLSWSCVGLLGALTGCSSDSDKGDESQAENPLRPTAAAGSAGDGSATASGAEPSGASTPSPAAPPSAASSPGRGAGSEGMDNVVGLANPAASGGPSGAAGPAPADPGIPAAPSEVCPPGPFPASPLPTGATVQEVCTGMTFSEGTVWFQDLGTLFFSDFQIRDAASNFNGRIMSYTPGGQCQEFIANTGTNGLVIAPDGNLLGARHSDQTLTLFNLMTKQATVFVADFGGASFNAPNDIVIRSDGNMYFTDADYMRGNRPAELPTQAYRRDPSGGLSVIDTATQPNGINLSPDEQLLYLSHLSGPNDVVVFDVDETGGLSNRRPFLNVGSDGMAMDCAGNLYITQAQAGVRIYDPNGNQLGTLPANGAANAAFGGPDRKTLYIGAQTRLYAVDLAIPGLPY